MEILNLEIGSFTSPQTLVQQTTPPVKQREIKARSYPEDSSIKSWTPGEEHVLTSIYSDPLNKMSIEDIAKLFGRSKKSIERKKEKMKLGSSRKNILRPKPHLTYPERKPGASLHLVPAYSLLEDKKNSLQPFLPFLEHSKRNSDAPTPAQRTETHEQEQKIQKDTPWSVWDINCLTHYWGLRALGIQDIAVFLRRPVEEIQAKAQELKLPEKSICKPTTKYIICTGWKITSETVQSNLTSEEQHALAELTATRLSHLCTNPCGTSPNEKHAKSEIDSLFEVQRHIFHKAIRSKARKLAKFFNDSISKEEELIQVGESTLFEVISQWDPSRGINFCRGTVAQNIEREMQQWLRSCRVVKLPSGLIQEIVEERHRRNGNERTPQTRKTAQRKESIERYLYSVHPERASMPLNESPEETDDQKFDQVTAGQENNNSRGNIVDSEHQSFCNPDIEKEDIRELLAQICVDLPKNEKYAFCQYFGVGEEGEPIPHKNLRELGEDCGVTAERIRQRINLAREKMMKKLARTGIHCSADAI